MGAWGSRPDLHGVDPGDALRPPPGGLPQRSSLQGSEARAVGVLLGKMCGDALGAGVEGHTSAMLKRRFPNGYLDFVDNMNGLGRYTDDSQMAIALARSLAARHRCELRHVSLCYAADFGEDRGYAAYARQTLRDLRAGADPRVSGTKYFKEGSWGNGGAMRIAPLGFAYRHASADTLLAAVTDALLCTHVHPVAVDGAFVIASAVAMLATSGPGPSPAGPSGASPAQPAPAGQGTDAGSEGAKEAPSEGAVQQEVTPGRLLEVLLARARTDDVRSKILGLQAALVQGPVFKGPQQAWAEYLASPAWEAEVGLHASLVGDRFQLRTDNAVAAALMAVCWHWGCPEEAMVAAVHYGGDTDTIAAMVGGMVGALHGAAWIPDRWWDRLENGHLGRDQAYVLALKLATVDVRG